MSRLAYLITSYTLPHQVLRLARTLRAGSPEGSIVIHHDDRRCSLDRAALTELGARFVEPPSPVGWGGFSQLAMVLRCLSRALSETDFDWLVLLSGQDYPIRPVAEIERALASGEFDAFIEARVCERPALSGAIDEFAGRYHFRWWRTRSRALAGLASAAQRRVPLVLSRTLPSGRWIGVPAVHSPFGAQLTCRCGSDWFSLSRAAVEAIERFRRAWPEVERYYRRTLIPSESFVQTVLANDTSLRLCGDHRRYALFDAPHATGPRVLTMDDLGAILASGADFARKFDETIDSDVLDEIDRRAHCPGALEAAGGGTPR